MIIVETMESFTPAKQENLKTNLRNETGCYEPSCFLVLKISAGSIAVVAVLIIPDDAPDGVNASALAVSVETAATQLVSQNSSALSLSLGVPVQSTDSVSVEAGVLVPLVITSPLFLPPPPPFPPQPPSSPPAPLSEPPPTYVPRPASWSTTDALGVAFCSASFVWMAGVAMVRMR